MQATRSGARIGYIGVDVLNNATICNETTALLERDVPLDLVSVYNIKKATFYQDDTLKILEGRIHHLYPLNAVAMAWDILRAPFLFGGRFFTTLWKALTGKVEGPKQRLKMVGHLLPAIKLALHWRDKSINHVHCQWAHTATTIGMHAAELLGVGFSFMGHANDLFVHRVALEDKVRRARYILCISEYHRRFYLDMGADAKRLHVVYCGVSLDRFKESKPFNPDVRRIVSVGRLVEKKGFDDLIRACAVLRDRGIEFECVIAGSGPEEANLNRLIDDFDLHNRVSITGEPILQEEIPDFLRSARLFVLPCVKDSDGDMDGLPQVLIESMACRVPSISTFLVGIPDLVRHEENGLLVETRNVAACADAIERLMEDDQLVQQFGGEAEAWAKAHFGRDELVSRLEQIFEWSAATPGQSAPDKLLPPAPGSEQLYDDPQFSRGAEESLESASIEEDEPAMV